MGGASIAALLEKTIWLVSKAMEFLKNIQVIIAILATVIATAIGILNFRRNKARISVESLTSISKDRNDIQITVTNVGTKDVTIIAIGFAVLSSKESILPWTRRKQRKSARRYSALGSELLDDKTTQDETILLKPTERKVLTIPTDFVSGWVGSDEVAWPYAEDTTSCDVYAKRPV